MEDLTNTSETDRVPIKLLLFIDKRPSSGEYVKQVRSYLKQLETDQAFLLDVVDVSEQPYLVEHFRLIATPALVKFSPGEQHVISGSNILTQLEQRWSQWQQESNTSLKTINEQFHLEKSRNGKQKEPNELIHSVEVMKLSDEIFRLNQEKEDLEAQLQFKNRIVAMLAHDLRNPLTAASIAVETLELGYGQKSTGRSMSLSPELTPQLLRHAKKQIRAMDRMISDILQTAKGAGADLQIQPQEISFNALFAEALASMQNRFEARSQQINIDIPQDLPHVYVDSGQIQRVLFNLLDNAIKYTPKGGQIHVSALHRTTQKIQICVQDTGPGVPPEKCEAIFEDSFRLQRDESKDGYGLGLALCRRIVRAHYGQIWAESDLGEGSQFYFTLPVFRS
ncbi:histidine kinase [Oscillatoria sp. CS-180]|uniref:histidine kinase n=1 Tax=Oscillatoria sp. CS-180 TaxID=3021720 RepID=UPI00232E58D1|nr:histidine kinase [Oscillatoria sp. CS-180]MDB9528994.1 histidine kinase [Oscillatoria sp. CS-180]